MSFNQLSDELILEIANQLRGNYHVGKSLRSLALCSCRLNDILGPIVRSKFTQTSKNRSALPNLLLRVMEKPQVGSEIKKLVLIEICESNSEDLDMSRYSPEDFDRCRVAIESFEVPVDNSEWMKDVERGAWDAVVALLLFFLPALEEIEIESSGLWKSPYHQQIIQHMASKQLKDNSVHCLKRLKKVINNYWDHWYGMSPNSILLYCVLPSVTTVCGKTIAYDSPGDWERIPKRYQVKNLRLGNTCLSPDATKNLLIRFDSLRKFYYTHGGACVGYSDFLPQYIGAGIAHLHNSLEELTIIADGNKEVLGDEPSRSVGSLVHFEKLRCLATEADILFGSDSMKPRLINILPASLELLILEDCEDDIYPQLRELISYRKEKFPALKTVGIDIPAARKGAFHAIGPDGLHEREKELKKEIELAEEFPDNPSWKEYFDSCTKELQKTMAAGPTEAEWEVWRVRSNSEKEIIAEYREAGINLRFNLAIGDTHEFDHSCRLYDEYWEEDEEY